MREFTNSYLTITLDICLTPPDKDRHIRGGVSHNATLQAIRDTKPGPPMVARMLAIVHTAIYDAWAAYDPVSVGTRLAGGLRRPIEE